MSYASVGDIQYEFKNITFSSSTTPTSTAVSEFITQTEALVNSKLSTRYTTPITGTESLSLVKMIVVTIVSRRIKEIIAVKTGKPEVDTETKGAMAFDPMKMLLDISMNRAQLNDAQLASSGDGVSSFASSNDIPATFLKDTKQW
jgi:hypothetical protein